MKLHLALCWLVEISMQKSVAQTNQAPEIPDQDLNIVYYCAKTNMSQQPWCIPKDYNKHVDPFSYSHLTAEPLPWDYNFSFFPLEVTDVNDLSQTITIMMYLWVEWMEPRLNINVNSTEWAKVGQKGTLRLPSNGMLWYPDLEIYGLKTFGRMKIIKDVSYTKITLNNKIQFSTYSDITITCEMDFDNFPLDSQVCNFWIGSYSLTNDIVSCTSQLVSYQTGPLHHQQRTLQYDVIWKYANCKKAFEYLNGKYDFCGFQIFLRRNRINYLISVYVPTCMFVVVSWVSFIIKPKLVPGRMTLLITIFLVLINILNEIRSTAPSSKNLHAVDLYLIICILHLFGVMAEYSVVLVILRYVGTNNRDDMISHQISEHNISNRRVSVGQINDGVRINIHHLMTNTSICQIILADAGTSFLTSN